MTKILLATAETKAKAKAKASESKSYLHTTPFPESELAMNSFETKASTPELRPEQRTPSPICAGAERGHLWIFAPGSFWEAVACTGPGFGVVGQFGCAQEGVWIAHTVLRAAALAARPGAAGPG